MISKATHARRCPPRHLRIGATPYARSRAFTLIELLVVVSILALLLAILLPSLREARRQSKRLVCQSNLRQIAIASHSYVQENDGRFYRGMNANVNYGGRQGMVTQYQKPKPLNPYLKAPDVAYDGARVFLCPSDRGADYARPTCFAFFGTSYNTNLMLIGDKLTINPEDPCKPIMDEINDRLSDLNRSQVDNDSKVILLGDFGWVNAWSINSSQRIEWHHRPYSHNIAFIDGHVDFVRIRKGLHVTNDYSVIPWKDLQVEVLDFQEEVLPQ